MASKISLLLSALTGAGIMGASMGFPLFKTVKDLDEEKLKTVLLNTTYIGSEDIKKKAKEIEQYKGKSEDEKEAKRKTLCPKVDLEWAKRKILKEIEAYKEPTENRDDFEKLLDFCWPEEKTEEKRK